MTHYADPQRCPDCGGPIQFGARSCAACDLPLVGPTAGALFSTLAQADELLRSLRVSQQAVAPASDAASAADVAMATANPDAASALTPVATRDGAPPRPRGGLSAASVPKILLGLGAVCLLVAALVFLAVTWSVMGVAGRTATLVGFTVVAGLLAGWLAHRDLRAAAEALTLVALGLLTFDLFGARDSGWFGDITEVDFLVLVGAVLTVVAAAAGLAARRTPIARLTGAEVVAALGVAAIGAGLSGGDRLASSAAFTVSVVIAAGAGLVAYRLRLVTFAVGATVVSGGFWLLLLASSLERAFSHPSARELWLDLEVWPLVTAAALVGAVALVPSLPRSVRVAAVAVAEPILAVVAVIPFTQGTGTEITLAVLGVLVASWALTRFAPEPWSWGCAVTTALAGLWMAFVGGLLTLAAAGRVADAGAFLWDGSVDGRLPAADDADLAAWLLPVAVAAVIATGVVLARAARSVDRLLAPLTDPVLGIGLAAAATIGTVASYPVPVWLVCAMMGVAAVMFVGWAVTRPDPGISLAVGVLFLAGALALSLYDEWLTAGALLAGIVLGTVVHLRWRRPEVSTAAGFLVASWLAASIWTWGAIADAEGTWTALTVLVALTALVLGGHPVATKLRRVDPETAAAQPGNRGGSTFVGVETGAAVSMFAFGLAGVSTAPVSEVASWTAVYLTVAGAAVTTVSLLRADRRILGWAGGLLLAMASWVRLWDIGVEAPEAYTVPSAVALGLVGYWYLRRTPTASTMTGLGPALCLGLVPSLLWVLWEPATTRSLLLGLACLLLVMAGARMRWTAPVVFAGMVGALVVLRHAAPFVDEAVPRWMLIATAGTILISMGITWERRIQEARAVVGYVRTLR